MKKCNKGKSNKQKTTEQKLNKSIFIINKVKLHHMQFISCKLYMISEKENDQEQTV